MPEITVYTHADPREIRRFEDAFAAAAPGVHVSVRAESPFLTGERILPYLELQDGQRHFGEQAVHRYLEELGRSAKREEAH